MTKMSQILTKTSQIMTKIQTIFKKDHKLNLPNCLFWAPQSPSDSNKTRTPNAYHFSTIGHN